MISKYFVFLVFLFLQNESNCENNNEDDLFKVANSNEEFIKWLKSKKILKCPKIENALRKVDKLKFVPPLESCYMTDMDIALTYGANMEYPSLLHTFLENIEPHLKPNGRVLEIGSGTGYLTSILSHLMNETGQVIAMEHIPELVNISIQNILHTNPQQLQDGKVKFVVADGKKGYSKKAPYDVILVSVSVPQLSNLLIEQLKPGGRLIIPLGEPRDIQTLYAFDKLENGTLQKTEITSGCFGYIQDREHQVEVWTNATNQMRINMEKLCDMKNFIDDNLELRKIEKNKNSMERIEEMFENAKHESVDKDIESYEREMKMDELLNKYETESTIPIELEELINDIKTEATKKTRKKKISSTTEKLNEDLFWK